MTLPALRREIEAHEGDLGAAVGRWAAAAMQTGLKYELVLATDDYHDRALAGKLPRLLDDVDGDRGVWGRPTIQVRQPWGRSASAPCRTSSRRRSARSTSTAAT